jgi:hypothetical protein
LVALSCGASASQYLDEIPVGSATVSYVHSVFLSFFYLSFGEEVGREANVASVVNLLAFAGSVAAIGTLSSSLQSI